MSILTWLDQSASFDMVDNSILLSFIITSLSLLECYLSGKTQAVRADAQVSAVTPLTFGVPQELV